MAILSCKSCGGSLVLEPGSAIAQCEYCGTRQTVPLADDDRKLRLFEDANRLRRRCDFDRAENTYRAIVSEFPQEAEAWWGLVLCSYGIEYVDDPYSDNKVPTCHRSSFESILADEDYRKALECADPDARELYQQEAEKLERNRRKIIEISSKEAPYDIFICYKESDAEGNRTVDSEIAEDIYNALTAEGYRTFFSRISLEDKIGEMYEPYIFAALNSAKVMLVVGTDPAYFEAVWVRNEWGRYLKRMEREKNLRLIPCYKYISPYELPRRFQSFQSQDMGKVGAQRDLIRGIEKYVSAEKPPVPQQKPKTGTDKLQTQLERGRLALEDGDWKEATVFFENALNLDPQNAQAYLGKLLVEYRLHSEAELDSLMRPINISKNYEKVLRFGDPDLQERLLNCSKSINHRIDTYNSKKDHLADSRVEVLSRIDESRYALQQAMEKTRNIQRQIGQTNSRLVQLLAVVTEKQRKVDELKSWKPRNVGKILFYLLCIVATAAAIFYCLEHPEFSDEGWSVLVVFGIHYLIWVVRDLQKGKTVGRILLRTLLLLLKAVFSIGVVAALGLLVLLKIFPDLPDTEQILFCCIPAVYFPICIFKQLGIQRRRKKNIRTAMREVDIARKNYNLEADNNPELKRLSNALEAAQNEYNRLEMDLKKQIDERYSRYVEEARKGGFEVEDLIPNDLRLHHNT